MWLTAVKHQLVNVSHLKFVFTLSSPMEYSLPLMLSRMTPATKGSAYITHVFHSVISAVCFVVFILNIQCNEFHGLLYINYPL